MSPRACLVAFALMLAPLAALAATSDEEDRPEAPTVSVVGVARAQVRPDMAVVTLNVTAEKPTANDAANENTRLMTAVLDGLKGSGVDAKDIETLALNIAPIMTDQRDPKTNAYIKTTVTGFRAFTRLSVRVRVIDRAGAYIANAVQNGALYEAINFDLADREAREDELRAKAVENAAHRASVYAGGAHLKLGALRSLAPIEDYSASLTKSAPRMMAVASAPVAPLDIEPGMLTLSEGVNAVYELTSP